PEFYLPTLSKTPMVPVFHDLAYEHYPQYIGKWAANYCLKHSPKYAERANHLLTVSDFSKKDIIDTYGIAEDKISVVYNGASEAFSPISEKEQQEVRNTYTEGAPFFHFVGAIHPRKNITSILKAFDAFRARVGESVKLLLVGRKGWKYDDALQVYEQMQYKEEVIFTGFVSDEELKKIYGASLALCYVPVFEGFGIPVLEAMQAETAVIAGDVSSIPEVAGGAAVMVDPQNVEGISAAMSKLFLDPQERKKLIEKGRIQRQKFSWDRTYELSWKVLEQFL
ncbi:MAG: glycosyltransferase family 1 protein, partial [Bacteroidota bacterium]